MAIIGTALVILLGGLALTLRPSQVRMYPATVTIRLSSGTLVFRRIAPETERLNFPAYYFLETEVPNWAYRDYLRDTGRNRDDQVILDEIHRRRESRTFSTGDSIYSVEHPAGIWRNGDFPAGREDHPVSLLTLGETQAFCDWLTVNHPQAGTFRLPTWNEWMIAAYGRRRAYPWGNEWHSDRTLYGVGRMFDEAPKDSEPVKSRPDGRTPEGLYGMLGNVSEYLSSQDTINQEYFSLGTRWMGGSFDDGKAIFSKDIVTVLEPRLDYWGYAHSSENRMDYLGFRVLLSPSDEPFSLNRNRMFEQNNNSWRMRN